MSGPIVRRYGFPNFDQIFGKKEVPHGVDEPADTAEGPKAEGVKDAEKSEQPPAPVEGKTPGA